MRGIYKINILNWEKYNKGLKRGHKCVLISTRFLDDAKVASLPQGGKLLYLSLLLACGEVTSSSIEASHEVLVRSAGGCGQHVVRLLDQMQSLRLLTWSKNEVFLNRIEEKGIEKKRKEEKIVSTQSSSAGVEKSTSAEAVSRSALILVVNEQDLISKIPKATLDRWSALYPEQKFIHREVLRAFNWYENNQKKKPKTIRGWVQALSSWFERSWPQYQKTIEATKNVGLSETQLTAILKGEI